MFASIQQAIKDCSIIGNEIFLPDYTIPKAEYPKVKKAITGIGGKWTPSSQSFVFKDDPTDLFDQICSGEKIDLEAEFKKTTQYFPTPKHVIRKMNEYIGLSYGNRVLEPSAGKGKICDFLKETYTFDWNLDVCEMVGPFADELKEKGYNVAGSDFLEMPSPEKGYNLIIANPPFSNNQDVKHFLRMYELLAPGGRIITIMSKRWETDGSELCKQFRQSLAYYFHSLETIKKGAFKDSGTNIETYLLVVDKPLEDKYLDTFI